MDKYIYFVSQLPMLQFGQEPLISEDSFLVEAEKWLSEKDLEILSGVTITGMESEGREPGVLHRYRAFQADFQHELVRWRKSHGTDQEYKPRSFQVSALKEGTPLDAEHRMMRWFWDVVDAEEHEHHFDLEFLIIYYIKLQILNRLKLFDKELGLETYHTLCEAEEA